MENEKKQIEKEKDECPLCEVSEETIKKLKTAAKQKEPEKEREEQS